jgi:ATP-dependent Clp protease ATP-binding subunit ClpA
MFELYTEKARRVIFFARYEASQLGSPFIETEHVLLGLLREAPDLQVRFLSGPDRAPAEAIRRRIVEITASRPTVPTSQDLPLSHESKRVLGYAADECARLRHPHIGPEHLFLGLLREEKCLAADVLHERGVRLSQVREEIARSGPSETGRASEVNLFPGVGIGRPPGGGASPGMPLSRTSALFRDQFGAGGYGWMSALQDAGRVLLFARIEAAQRRSPCIETTDLLLALTHEKEVTERFLLPAESIRELRHLHKVTVSEKVSAEELPFSEDCKLACTLAAEEAAQLGQPTAPGHLLLGLLRVESCAAAKTLRDCGLTAAGIRAQLAPPPPPSDPEQGRKYV